jgi:hypothetical protein
MALYLGSNDPSVRSDVLQSTIVLLVLTLLGPSWHLLLIIIHLAHYNVSGRDGSRCTARNLVEIPKNP